MNPQWRREELGIIGGLTAESVSYKNITASLGLSISLKSFGGIIFNGNMALGVGAAIRLVIFGFLGTIVI